MKKTLLNLLAIILAVSMVFTMAPLSMEKAYADDPITTTIDGVVYTLNEDDGTAAVTGFDHDNPPTQVRIPSSFDFAGCDYTVTSIRSGAFDYCTNLMSITIPESVTSIGENAFSDCTGLTTINFLGSEYQWNAITGDGKPTGVTVNFAKDYPASTTINGVVYVLNEDRTAKVESYTEALQAGVTILSSVSYKDEDYTVKSIAASAFENCTNLMSITIPESVTSIGENAFSDCTGLTTINYGGSQYQWDLITGDGKPANVTVIFAKEYPASTTINGVVYVLNEDRVAKVEGYTEALQAEVTILPNVSYKDEDYTVTSIGESAFRECNNLTSITIPDSVKSIETKAFYVCEALETIKLPDSIISIGINAFTNCGALKTIKLPDSLTSIGNYAFRWSGLESIIIPASVTSIGSEAFWGSSALTSVEFAEGSAITTIPSGLFSGCDKLEPIEIPEGVKSIGDSAFYHCYSMTTITIPESVTSIRNGAFQSVPLTAVNFGGSEYQWDAITGDGKPANVTVIFAKEYPAPTTAGGVVYLLNENGTATVTGYTANLPAEVIIPQSIKYENEDFTVKSIKDFAFMDCSSLKNITIPKDVTSIGNSAFWDSGLTSVTFAEGSKLTAIDAGAFAGCQSLATITIPEGVTSIENGAFYSCRSMETISIPESVTSIGANAFFGCDVLTTVNFGGSKSQWDAITGKGKPTGVTVNFAKEDPFKPISINGAGVALSATAFTYNGAVQKPAVTAIGSWKMAEGTDYTAAWSNAASKDIGTYSVAVTGKGKYKDSAAASYQIVPKGTTLKKPKKAKKAVTVKWKKQKAKMPKARISGYRIQLATDSNFTMNVKTVNVKGYKKTSKKVKKLKGKTMYYVRVCTYMKSGGNTYCSPWSNFKTVKTK